MSSNSLNFKGLQHGKSLEPQCFPSQSVNNKNSQKERDLANDKHRKQYLQLFLVILLMSNAMDSFSQTTAPKVHWRRFDWASQNPIISNSSASGQTFTRKESGSDWWYDVKNSFEPGATEDYPMSGMVHNGYILSGYSNIRNYTEAENGGGCNQAQVPQNLNCSYYEEGSDPTTPSWFHTVAKLKPDGLTMKWFHFLPFSGNGYRVTQLIDGSYIVVGDSKSTRNFNGNEIFYDPHFDVLGNPVFNAFCDGTNSLNPNSDGLINPKFIGVSHILANGTIDWTYNYGYFDYTVNSAFNVANINASAADAWDVKQSLPSGNIIILGTAEGPSVNNAFALSINIDGMRISKRLINIDAPSNVSNPGVNMGAIGKTLTCKNINGVEKIIIGTMVFSTLPALPSRTRTYLAQFNADLTDNPNSTNGDDWHLWLHDIQATPVNGADQQNIFSIIQLANAGNTNRYAVGMLKNCSYCSSAGNQNGEITVLTFEESNNIPTIANIHNCGAGNAFDLRVGLCKNIFSNDNGFALVSSKPNPDAANRPPFNCNITGGNITIHDYFDADTYIAAFDDAGSLKWENTYIDEQDETAPQLPPGNYKKQECMYSIVQTPDGGYMAAGNQSNNFDDNYLIKLLPENCADAVTSYDINPVDLLGDGVYYPHPSYVIKHPYGSFNIFSEVWSSSKRVKGTVVIPAGFELIITGTNTVITFDDSKQTGKDSKIIVLPGGKLRVENGAKLTSNGNCVDGLWDGIEVWGTNDQPQDLQIIPLDVNRPNELMSLNQGFVEIVGGSTIEKAMKGITAYNVESFTTGDTYYNGGIIQAADANFINNRNDIDISWYHDFNPTTNAEIKNKCYFKRCNFETNAPLANPGAVDEMICDMQLHLLYTDKHIHLWNVNGVSIEGCTFKTDLPPIAGKKPNYSKGIEAFDASFICTVSGATRNSFSNLQYGILNGSYNGSCDPQQYNTLNAPIAKIDRSDFVNCMRGIQLDGTIFTNINRCTFDITDTYGHDLYNTVDYQDYNMIHYGTLANVPVGIYTNASLAYNIKDNEFNSDLSYPNNWVVNYGMVNSNSSAFVSAQTQKNTYTNHFVHQQFEQSNLMLQSNCNQHSYTLYNDHYFWSVFDQLAHQGICDPNNIQWSVTNVFNNDVVGNNWRDIHLDWNSSNAFNYNANPNYLPLYFNTVNVNECFITGDDYADVCPPNIYPRVIGSQLSSYKSLLQSYNGLKKLIDNDSTEALLAYIDENQLGEIKNLPDSIKNLLSDETLLALIDRLPPANWNDFETILLNNSPLNLRLLEIINGSSDIPNPVKQSINNAQVGISARSIIDKQLLGLEIEKGIALNELISSYIDTGMVDSAMNLLAADHSIGAKMLGLVLDPNNYYGNNYNSDLNHDLALLMRTATDTISVEQLEDFISYFSNSANGITHTNNLSSSNLINLNNLANVNSIDGIYALVALSASNKATYGYNPKPINIVNGYRESPPEIAEPNANLTINKNVFDFKMQPNPANDIVKLLFDDVLATKFEIMDLTGNLLFSSSIQGNTIEVSLSNFANGFYLVKAYNSVYGARVKQLIIVK
jgi:hypothetical protein